MLRSWASWPFREKMPNLGRSEMVNKICCGYDDNGRGIVPLVSILCKLSWDIYMCDCAQNLG
jgi:hypothetical protein